jgi:hypothetical protein
MYSYIVRVKERCVYLTILVTDLVFEEEPFYFQSDGVG